MSRTKNAGEKTEKFICSYCNASFDMLYARDEHIRTHPEYYRDLLQKSVERIKELENNLKGEIALRKQFDREKRELEAQQFSKAEWKLIKDALVILRSNALMPAVPNREYANTITELLKKVSFLLGESGMDLIAQKSSPKTKETIHMMECDDSECEGCG